MEPTIPVLPPLVDNSGAGTGTGTGTGMATATGSGTGSGTAPDNGTAPGNGNGTGNGTGPGTANVTGTGPSNPPTNWENHPRRAEFRYHAVMSAFEAEVALRKSTPSTHSTLTPAHKRNTRNMAERKTT